MDPSARDAVPRPGRSPGGRRPKLTPATAAALVQAARAGLARRVAAGVAGVAPQTVYNWLARGRRDRTGPFRELLDALKKAEAEAVVDRVKAIHAAADRGHWQAAAWWLERRHPDEFGRNRGEVRALRREVAGLLAELRAHPVPAGGPDPEKS